MLLLTPVACLLLGWPQAPVNAEGAKDQPEVDQAALYEVMQIKSGVEILVRHAGREITVRLLGIDTPAISPDSKVNVLNQMKFLHGLIQIGDKVCLETESGAAADARGHLLAQVYRASDGLSLNLDMIEQGFATTSTMPAFTDQAGFAAAEQVAKDAKLGMWAPDFLDHAAKPAQFSRRAPRRAAAPRFVRAPAGVFGGNNAARPGSPSGRSESDEMSRRQAESEARSRRESQNNDRQYVPTPVYTPFPNGNRWFNTPSFFPYPANGYASGGTMGPFGGTVIPGAGTPAGHVVHPGQSFGFAGGGYSGLSGGSSSGSSGQSNSSSSNTSHHHHP